MTLSLVRAAARTCEVIEPGGRRKVVLRVLCPRRGALDRSACEGCPDYAGELGGGDVACRVDEAERAAAERRGASAAHAAAPRALCVRIDVTGDAVPGDLLAAAGREGLAVVDDGGAFKGVLLGAHAALLGCRIVGELMRPRQAVVLEDQGLASALRVMARARLRAVPVITSEWTFVGVLHDVDALRAFASRSMA